MKMKLMSVIGIKETMESQKTRKSGRKNFKVRIEIAEKLSKITLLHRVFRLHAFIALVILND